MNSKTAYAFSFSIMCLLSVSCTGRQEQAEMPTVVKTARAVRSEASQRKEFPFIAKPLRTSELSFRVSGPIDRFEVYTGNHYKRGNIIAEIDPRDFRLRVENAEAVYRRAEADYKRIEALYKKDNVSAANYEQARAAWIAAKTAYDTALNELGDTQLRAPFDGYVGEVFIEKFQDVRAAQPVVTLVDISKLRIEVYVTQDIAMRADELKSVSLAFDHKPNEVFQADVVECARSTTSNNLSYLLTALLPNPDGKLPSGISGKVFFELPGEMSPAVAVPQSALCHRPSEGDFVWKIDPATGTVARQSVTLGELLPDGTMSVTSGLSAGETVAVSGLRFLSDGMKIQIDDSPKVQPVEIMSR
ncbi:MAG: efflux RND transporter periplasmic adaptor subunit [Alistipes sp.]|uniref:efflux RND transporter periplasmic adaptor subunit n=1 Tax=Alistipes sp. TaxID=1872444 RepID=UPI0025C26D85|nr:efflux RND transporter periplasmic adaptor subunit [Alistipes sp.]MCD8275070.1 efflux RND transporter periplasmic adaptor subunit [Alistipes sp.]